jgi:hypothetical protein
LALLKKIQIGCKITKKNPYTQARTRFFEENKEKAKMKTKIKAKRKTKFAPYSRTYLSLYYSR